MNTQTSDAGAQIVETNMARRKVGKQANTLQDFDPKQDKADEEAAFMEPTISEMAGLDGKPIEREGIVFYLRSPKIRALDAMAEALSELQSGGIKQGEAVLRTATFCLYVDEDGKRRQATFDEIADSFDLSDVELLSKLAMKYLNIKVTSASEGKSPNA